MDRHKHWIGSGCSCSAINCTNSRKKNPEMHFFRFPKHGDRAKKWVLNLRRADLLCRDSAYLYMSCRVCEQHFEDDNFMNAQDKNSLVPFAVPTIFNIPKGGAKKKHTTKRKVLLDPAPPMIIPRPQLKDLYGNVILDPTHTESPLVSSYLGTTNMDENNESTSSLIHKIRQDVRKNRSDTRQNSSSLHCRRRSPVQIKEEIDEPSIQSDSLSQPFIPDLLVKQEPCDLDESSSTMIYSLEESHVKDEIPSDDAEKEPNHIDFMQNTNNADCRIKSISVNGDSDQTSTNSSARSMFEWPNVKKECSDLSSDPLISNQLESTAIPHVPDSLHVLENFGVWSKTYIPKGTEFGPFPDRSLEELSSTPLSMWTDSLRDSSGDVIHNVEAATVGGHIWYRTITDIPPNAELFLPGLNHNTSKSTENQQDRTTTPEDHSWDLGGDINPAKNQNWGFGSDINITELNKNEKKPHRCAVCDKEFARPFLLKLHFRTHTGEKPHECPECGKRFSQNSGMRTHMLTHSGERSHHCEECGKQFARHSHLRRHLQSHTGTTPFECKLCDKQFPIQESLTRHMLTHTGQKPHMCTECGESFSLQCNLKRHMLVHTGEKRFQCKECGKKFPLKSNLKVHMYSHAGEKPYKCEQCGKSFSDNSNLKLHLLVHTGERPHECPLCGKCFSRNSNLKTHIKMHIRKSGQKDEASANKT